MSAQLGTADVTYTKLEATGLASPSVPQNERQFTMLFPAGATNVLYTSGGIPINNGQLGCPAALNKFIIEDMACSTGYVAKWDNVANTIRLYWGQNITAATASQLIEVLTSATVASCTLRVLVAGW
jgi:hypothetical protein